MVFPSQFSRLLVQYQEHPEAKSLAPDGAPCRADTRGLLKRTHVIAGELRYVGKESDRKWEEGDDISVLEFKATEYGRAKKVVADISIADQIRAIGVRKTMGLTKMSQHTIEKLIRREAVKRKTHEHVLKAIRGLQIDDQNLWVVQQPQRCQPIFARADAARIRARHWQTLAQLIGTAPNT